MSRSQGKYICLASEIGLNEFDLDASPTSSANSEIISISHTTNMQTSVEDVEDVTSFQNQGTADDPILVGFD